MKIHCPACNTAYSIPDEKVSSPAMKAVCKKCGAKMVINRESKTVKATPATPVPSSGPAEHQEPSSESTPGSSAKGPTSEPRAPKTTRPEPEGSVASMSPAYPRHRDALIIGSAIVILITLLAGAHFLIKGSEKTLQELSQEPIEYLTDLIKGSERYKVCETFLRRNEKRFAQLGRDLQFSKIGEEISVINGRKTARLVIKVHGSAGTKNVHFRLEQRKGKWQIVSVALQLGKGKYETLYPRAKPTGSRRSRSSL